MEMESGQDAQAVVKNLDNYRLDKAHVLAVNRFADFEKFMATADEFEEPKEEPYVEKPNLGYYLVDEYARDQFAVLAGEQTQIYWNNRTIDPALVHERQAWTEAYLQWSPQGSYLTSIHKQGVALWGGEKWERVVRFAHPNVKLLDYSPGENYLITWSPELIGGKGENLRVWDIRSGKLLRGFATPENKKLDWPIFKWSPDDKLMARAAKDAIAVYELPAMTLLDGKPLKADGRQDFEWCPSVNGSDTYLIAYWTPESGNTPARVTVVDVKTKAIVRTKNFFLVSDVSLIVSFDTFLTLLI